jgi:hypothetical protein
MNGEKKKKEISLQRFQPMTRLMRKEYVNLLHQLWNKNVI